LFERGKIVEELRLLSEAFTHINDAEYSQSFVMSWSIIERYISELWKKRLDGKDMDGERIGKLLNSAQWSVDYQLEVLNLSGEIADGEYDIFIEMKSKRNKFIHKGKQIAKEDAERCFNLAKNIVIRKITS
jgi:hypothetical protein